MVEIYVVGQVVNFHPFDGFFFACIFFQFRIPTAGCIDFLDLCSTIYFSTIFAVKFLAVGAVLIDGHVTVHTNIHRRHVCMSSFKSTVVAIQTAYLVYTCVYFVRVEYRLLWLVVFIAAKTNSTLDSVITANDKQYNCKSGDIGFIAIERNRLRSRNALFIV